MSYQLCTRDEYRQFTILENSPNFEQLPEKAKKMVSGENMENALTFTEQCKDFTSIWVEFLLDGEAVDNLIYAGRNGKDQHVVLVTDEGENGEEVLLKDALASESDLSMRFYIGTVIRDRRNGVSEEYFAQNARGQSISEIDAADLTSKTFYFVKKI